MSVEKKRRGRVVVVEVVVGVESAKMKGVAEEADITAGSLSLKWETTASVAAEEVAMRKADADIVAGNNSAAVAAERNCS
jgi:hypothetical protein